MQKQIVLGRPVGDGLAGVGGGGRGWVGMVEGGLWDLNQELEVLLKEHKSIVSY